MELHNLFEMGDGIVNTNTTTVSVQPSVTARNAFLNALRILMNIDPTWLLADKRDHFLDNPFDFLVRADDPTVDKVWAMVEERQPACYKS